MSQLPLKWRINLIYTSTSLMHGSSKAIPAFPLLGNKPLPDAQAKALKTALARETALQNQLEEQHIELENEASKAQDIVSTLVTCHAASERVRQALDALKAAVSGAKDLVTNAINIHDTGAEAAGVLTTTTAAMKEWRDLIQLLEALTPQINATITSTKSHIVHTSDQVSTYKFVAESTRNSIAALDVGLDAIATSLSFKRNALKSIFRIPNEVFQTVFQLAVEKEREELRANFSSRCSFGTLEGIMRTIPQCPFTLAAVCREWRNIALHTPRLWSYIRVYTSFYVAPGTQKKPAQHRWVGKTAFEISLQRAEGVPLELAIYQDPFKQRQSSPNFPPDAKISIIYLVRLARAPEWLPSCSHLSLFDYPRVDESILREVQFPSFPTGPKEISCENVLPTFLTPLDSTTKFSFSSKFIFQMPDLNRLSESFPNLNTLLLLIDNSAPSAHPNTIIPRTWESLTTLVITISVLPSLAAHAQTGLSIPSLTLFILTNVFASLSPSDLDMLKCIVQTLTSLDIHNISPSVKPSEWRTLIDSMESLHTVELRRDSESLEGSENEPGDYESLEGSENEPGDSEYLEGSENEPEDSESLEGSENEPGDSESLEEPECGPVDSES